MAVTEESWSIWRGDELLSRDEPLYSSCVVALGTFDGVHLGHQRILENAASIARERGWPAVAFTFDRHPAATLAPARQPGLLTSFQRRLALILEEAIDHVVVVRFDDGFCRVSAEDFVREILCGALGAKALVVGYDFRFGCGARGDVGMLEIEATRLGFDLNVVPPVTASGTRVSSTLIRKQITQGDVEGAATLLGRPFRLRGTVVAGDARGRTLGFPTANLEIDQGLLIPGDGVYLTRVHVASPNNTPAAPAYFHALTAIGSRPSFGEKERAVESFLLNFDGDLYGRELEIEFLRRLRGIVRFQGKEELIRQIEADVEAARDFFGLEGP